MRRYLTADHRTNRLFQVGLIAASSLWLVACNSDNDSSTGGVGEQGATGQSARPAPDTVISTAIGNVLAAGASNKTIYTFANDAEGGSNCNDGCATVWPPVTAESEQSEGVYRTVTRTDASLQWAFKGSPLYYYQGDAAEGDINGEGINDVWYVARPDPIAGGSTSLGDVLTASGSVNAGLGDSTQRLDLNGRTLYVFANDAAGTSNCSGSCVSNWPPLLTDQAALAAGDYTIIERDGGNSQWAYKGQALYFYAGDNAAGDTTGDGVGGVWSVARP